MTTVLDTSAVLAWLRHLGDRCCLALGTRLALTTVTAWANLDIPVHIIR